MNPQTLEQARIVNLQRLTAQLQEQMRDTLKSLMNVDRYDDRDKNQLCGQISKKIDLIRFKLGEYSESHWKLFQESDERSIFQLGQDIRYNFRGMDTRVNLIQYLQAIPVCVRDSQGLKEMMEKEISKWEFWDAQNINHIKKSHNEVHALLIRSKDIRYWYATIYYDPKSQLIFDIILNFIDVDKELQSINKFQINNNSTLLRKLNEWIRILYFSQTSLKDLIDIKNILNYTNDTLKYIFPSDIRFDNRCKRCKDFMRLSLVKDEGYLIPYILSNDSEVEQNKLYHFECFFKNF